MIWWLTPSADGPLMGINHARSAHAALNEARLIQQQNLRRSFPGRGSAAE